MAVPNRAMPEIAPDVADRICAMPNLKPQICPSDPNPGPQRLIWTAGPKVCFFLGLKSPRPRRPWHLVKMKGRSEHGTGYSCCDTVGSTWAMLLTHATSGPGT